MALGEEKADDLREAWADLDAKLAGGLNPLFYKDVPFLPIYIAAGSVVQFGFLKPDGRVSLSSFLILNIILVVILPVPDILHSRPIYPTWAGRAG